MQQYKVVFTPAAISDMRDIYNYITEDSGYSDRALDYINKLRAGCERMCILPLRGQKRDDIRPNLRTTALDKRAVAAFEVEEDNHILRILGVYYGGRDYAAILQTDDN